MEKKIILVPNQTPQFIGNWTVGEIRQMAQGLMMWLESLNIPPTPTDEELKEDLS